MKPSSESLNFGEIVGLVRRCWPYYRPMMTHLVIYLVLNALVGVLYYGAFLVWNDVVFNKIVTGTKLQPFQAGMFLLDETYLADPTAESESADLLTDEQRMTVRNRFIVWIFVFVGILMASIALVSYYMAWIYQAINQSLRVRMLNNAQHLPLAYHQEAGAGDAIYRVYQDSAAITNVLQNFIITPARAFGMLLLGLGLLSLFSLTLGFLAALVLVPVGFVLWGATPRIRRLSRLQREANSALTVEIQETLSAIRVLKANGAEERAVASFNAASHVALDAAFEFRKIVVLVAVGVSLIVMTAMLVGEYFAAQWTIAGDATLLGGAVAFVGFAIWNLGAFRQATDAGTQYARHHREVSQLWALAQDLTVGLERAFFLLDLEARVTSPKDPVAPPTVVDRVNWDDVVFGYGTSSPILDGVSLEARKGEITAIVGPSGAGKSTLLSLLLRTDDPASGSILINGQDIRDFDLAALRSMSAVALQKNVLFAATIEENIRYAEDAAVEAVREAATVAAATEFIEALPDGFETMLGERGAKLSTGQRQRLSIARAVLRGAPILILDEPTAALDARTERVVLERLRAWGRGRVVFLITHRLATIRQADQIAFLDGGVIREIGTHDELMAARNGYFDFVQAESAV